MKLKVQMPVFLVLLLAVMTITVSRINAAESVFQSKCSRCHALRDPDNYSKKEWKYNVERMAKRAGLTPQEIDEIIKLKK